MDDEDDNPTEESGLLTASDILLKHTITEAEVCDKARLLSIAELISCMMLSRTYLNSEENSPHPLNCLGWERYERILNKASILQHYCQAEIQFRKLAASVTGAEPRATRNAWL